MRAKGKVVGGWGATHIGLEEYDGVVIHAFGLKQRYQLTDHPVHVMNHGIVALAVPEPAEGLLA